jgi:AbiTii
VVLLVQPTVLEDMQCIAAWRVVTRARFVCVVDGVRNRLLDLVLELERQVPGAGDVPSSSLQTSPEQRNQIVQNTIYAERFTMSDQSIHVQGTAGNIAGGQGNLVQQGNAQITQQDPELACLLPALRAAVRNLGDHLPPTRSRPQVSSSTASRRKPSDPSYARPVSAASCRGLTAIATVAGPAGAAVIDAVQRIGHALGT